MTMNATHEDNNLSKSTYWNAHLYSLAVIFLKAKAKKWRVTRIFEQRGKPCGYLKYLAGLMLFFPATVLAHVKWFAEENASIFVSNDNTLLYSVIWAAIASGIVVAGIFLEKKLPRLLPAKCYDSSEVFEQRIVSIFSLLIGIYFLLATYQGYLFSMNLNNVGQFHSILLGVQAFIGLSFLFGIGVRLSSLLLFGLWLFSFFYVDPLSILESLELLGVVVFTFIYGRKYFTYIQRDIAIPYELLATWREYVIPLLRIAIGLNLVILGFSEKILRPDLGLAFLEQHSWNFMRNYGVEWYSDHLFVFSAGAVEIILGLILVLGIVTRVCAAVVASFFLIPPFFMGLPELLGHLPHVVIILVLILFGSGNVLKLFSSSQKKQILISKSTTHE